MKRGFLLKKQKTAFDFGLPWEHVSLDTTKIAVRSQVKHLCFIWHHFRPNIPRPMVFVLDGYPRLEMLDCGHRYDSFHYHHVKADGVLSDAINMWTDSSVAWCRACVDRMMHLSLRNQQTLEYNVFMLCAQREELSMLPAEVIEMIGAYLLMPKFTMLDIGNICR